MGRRRACLPIPAGLPHYPQISRGQTLGRSAIPDCPGGSTVTSLPFASLRAKGRSASGRVPPMDYLDNPERRSAARPSDDTSANSYGFAVASTPSLGCKYRLCCLACALGEPDVEDGDHAGGQRRDAQFPPLSQAADMRASVEVDIGAPKADQLGHPQPCLSREREQGAVAPSSRSRLSRDGK